MQISQESSTQVTAESTTIQTNLQKKTFSQEESSRTISQSNQQSQQNLTTLTNQQEKLRNKSHNSQNRIPKRFSIFQKELFKSENQQIQQDFQSFSDRSNYQKIQQAQKLQQMKHEMPLSSSNRQFSDYKLTNLQEVLINRQKLRDFDVQISPDLAALVIEKYLLPIFEEDSKVQLNKKRDQQFGISKQKKKQNKSKQQNNLQSSQVQDQNINLKIQEDSLFEDKTGEIKNKEIIKNNTVYEELKLSDRFFKELKTTRKQLEETNQKLRDAYQSMEGVQNQLNEYKQQALQEIINKEIINEQYNSLVKLNSLQETAYNTIQQKYTSLSEQYTQSESSRQEAFETLRQEKAKSDQLLNNHTMLVHENTVLKVENEIVGERLAALFSVINGLYDNKNQEDRIQKQLRVAVSLLQNETQLMESLLKKLSITSEQKEEIQNQTYQQAKDVQELIASRNKLKILAETSVNKLSKLLDEFKDQNEKLNLGNNEQKKKIQILTDELDKCRSRMKTLKARYKRFGDQELKTCKNCRQEYSEYENLNWSCRIHTSV